MTFRIVDLLKWYIGECARYFSEYNMATAVPRNYKNRHTDLMGDCYINKEEKANA